MRRRRLPLLRRLRTFLRGHGGLLLRLLPRRHLLYLATLLRGHVLEQQLLQLQPPLLDVRRAQALQPPSRARLRARKLVGDRYVEEVQRLVQARRGLVPRRCITLLQRKGLLRQLQLPVFELHLVEPRNHIKCKRGVTGRNGFISQSDATYHLFRG